MLFWWWLMSLMSSRIYAQWPSTLLRHDGNLTTLTLCEQPLLSQKQWIPGTQGKCMNVTGRGVWIMSGQRLYFSIPWDRPTFELYWTLDWNVTFQYLRGQGWITRERRHNVLNWNQSIEGRLKGERINKDSYSFFYINLIRGHRVQHTYPSTIILLRNQPHSIMEASQRHIYHVSIDTTVYNISLIEPECSPWAIPIFNTWIRTRHTRSLTETILGSIGAGAGFANAISIEALEHKLSALGHHIKMMSHVIEDQAIQEASVIHQGVEVMIEYFNLTSYLINVTQSEQTTIPLMTRCALVQLANVLKLEHDMQDWSQSNIHRWQKIITDTDINWAWIKVSQEKLQYPVLRFTVTTIVKGTATTAYPYLPLPEVINNHLWIPNFNSRLATAVKFVMTTHCEQWGFQRWLCPIYTPPFEPCAYNLSSTTCIWTQLNTDVPRIIDNGKGCVCVVSLDLVFWEDNSQSAPPVRECRCNVSHIRTSTRYYVAINYQSKALGWEAEMWNITLPLGFNVTSMAQLVWRSTQVQSQLTALTKTDRGVMLKIKDEAAELVKITRDIESLTTHHWWDIFRGWSPTMTNALHLALHPVFILLLITIILLFLICILYVRVKYLYTEIYAIAY